MFVLISEINFEDREDGRMFHSLASGTYEDCSREWDAILEAGAVGMYADSLTICPADKVWTDLD